MAEKSDTLETQLSWCAISRHNKPLLFKNRLSEWTCSNWTVEDWAENCEDIQFKFRVSSHRSDSHWESERSVAQATLKDFCSWQRESPSSLSSQNPLKKFNPEFEWCYSSYNYMAHVFKMHPKLLNILDWGNFGLKGRAGNDSTLWIGSRGSNTPCHQDSYGSNLVAQLIGSKLWVLFDPEDSDCLYPTRVPYEESSVFSSVNVMYPDVESFPRYIKSKPYLLVLEAGDVLYVPPKWWHYVISLETSMSVNTWVEHSLDDFWRLEEAAVRFAMSAFIPIYTKDKYDWINPNEELTSSSETSELLGLSLERCQATPSDTKTMNSDPKDLEYIEIKQLSFGEFEKEMSILTSYKRCSARQRRDRLADFINCFVQNNVLKAVTDNLINLKNK